MAYASFQKKEYQQSDSVTKAQDQLLQHQQNKPGDYSSKWKQTMDDLITKYQSRGPFQYDINADAMYQQMLDRYVGQGQQAMMDTMGQAAAMTGGYGNSYAQTVGQQTYQNYLQGAYDMMPQFYQMALDKYQMEGDDILSQYGLLSDQENMDYSRYMDQLNQYYAELDRLQGVYESERDFDYNKFATDQDFDYTAFVNDRDLQYRQDRDTVADDQWLKQYQYQQERDRIADQQWQRQFDEARRQFEAQMAFQRDQLAAQAARQAAANSGGSGGGYDIASEYNQIRSNGATTRESDSYLKAAIAAGLISEREATALRDSRYQSGSRQGAAVTPSKRYGYSMPNR